MTLSRPHGKRTLTSLVSLGASFLLSVDARPAPPAPTPDVEVVSLATSHSELAPDTKVLLTFALRAPGAAVPPFSAFAYYADGRATAGGVPKGATLLGTYPMGRGLSKGQTVSFEMPVRIPPCDACGPQTVYVAAGASVRTVTLDVAHDHLPDLRVSTVTIDKDGGSTSDRVGIRGTVQNDSRYFAEGPFRVSVYCSADETITPKDHRLFSFMVPSLPGGRSLSVDRTVELVPECTVYAATTWLGILADDQESVPEANEQNDGSAVPFWIFRAPDLTSHAVALSAKAGPVGSRVLVSYRIENLGGSAAGAFRTGVYLSRPGQALKEGTLLDSVDVPSLAANTESGPMQHLVAIPKVARGRYALGVWVDIEGENGELHRRNNFRTEPFDVTEINLTDVHFTAQRKDVDPGSDVELRLAVKNTGRDPAGATKIGLYYSSDPRFDRGEDLRLGEVDVEKLPAGAASREKTVIVAVPTNAREGYRFLLAVMDDTDVVAETDERDNVALEPILVGATQAVARTE